MDSKNKTPENREQKTSQHVENNNIKARSGGQQKTHKLGRLGQTPKERGDPKTTQTEEIARCDS